MANGQKTGGRKKGTPNRRTTAQKREMAAAGELPLEYMLRVMRDEDADKPRRDDMAKAAAKFCHAALASTEITGKGGEPIATKDVSDQSRVAALALMLAKAMKNGNGDPGA